MRRRYSRPSDMQPQLKSEAALHPHSQYPGHSASFPGGVWAKHNDFLCTIIAGPDIRIEQLIRIQAKYKTLLKHLNENTKNNKHHAHKINKNIHHLTAINKKFTSHK